MRQKPGHVPPRTRLLPPALSRHDRTDRNALGTGRALAARLHHAVRQSFSPGSLAITQVLIALAIVFAATSCFRGSNDQPSPSASPVATAAAASTSPAKSGTPRANNGKPNFLSTKGSKIVDSEGKEVRLTGINWFGMETGTFAPHGLWARSYQEMLDQVVDLGYNCIRLPYSSRLLDPNAKPLEGIDFRVNPDLKGLNGIEIMDVIVQAAGQRGLKVLLDRHRPDTETQSKLWYTEQVTEEHWLSDWRYLAERYKGNDTVIGADLHNEPAGNATWGTDDPKTDWRLAAERAGNAILAVNPDWLIVVEGVENYKNDGYWWGGNLMGVAEHPVRLNVPNKLVYSAHDYGPGVSGQSWFHAKDFPANMPAIWDAHWGYIAKQGIAPVLVGEFGGRSVSPKDTEGIWQRALVDYLNQNGMSFTYWSLNPNSGDTGGILADDWRTVQQEKQALLAGGLAPKLPVNVPERVHAVGPPLARKDPLPTVPLRVFSKGGAALASKGEFVLDLRVDNLTSFRAPLTDLELHYWLNLENADPSAYQLTLDWASVEGVRLELLPPSAPGKPSCVKIAFDDFAGMMPRQGKLELKVRVKGPEDQGHDQGRDYSFAPGNAHSANERVALYLWGERLWGAEPG